VKEGSTARKFVFFVGGAAIALALHFFGLWIEGMTADPVASMSYLHAGPVR